MKRQVFTARDNFRSKLHSVGFDYEVANDAGRLNWREDRAYRFDSSEVQRIEQATKDLSDLCFRAVDYVIDNNLFEKFSIPEKFVPLIKESWERDDFTLYGRFDLAYKDNKIKMYEYNADTPTALVEAALAQHDWKEDNKLPDQYNFIHEQMIEQWKHFKKKYNMSSLLGKNKVLYFSCISENQEDFRNTEYLMDLAHQAGIKTKFIYVEDIGSDGEFFYDLEENKIEYMFKLFPWEWMVHSDFADTILKDNCLFIEPIWKMILSNKALLPILSEMVKKSGESTKHLLLESSFEPLSGDYVRKPLLSREGQNIQMYADGKVQMENLGEYGEEGYIYQEMFKLPIFDENYAVIGSWVVGDVPCGMGVREDITPITANNSYFCPHYF